MTRTVLWSSSAGDIPANLAFTNNLDAATDPVVGTDSSLGYSPGSVWVNTTDDRAFVCVDATVGAAVWLETGSGPAGQVQAPNASTPTGIGGAALVEGGAGGTTSGAGGAATTRGGAATAGNSAGGAADTTGGVGSGSAAGGVGKVAGGAGGLTGAGGAAQVVGGVGGATSGAGGAASVAGGAGTAGNSTGGVANVTGGAGQGTAAGADANLTGGASGAGATGNGGDANVTGGAAASTNGSGGSVVLAGGAKAGSGIAGGVRVESILIRQQAAPTAKTVSATLTAAELLAGIITVTQGAGAASNQQVPTGTAIQDALPIDFAVGDSFDVSVINLGAASEVAALTVNTDVTIVGNAAIPIAATGVQSSGLFRFRKTADHVFVAYRIA